MLGYFNRNPLVLPIVALAAALVAFAVDRGAWLLVVLAALWLGLSLVRRRRGRSS